MARKNAFYAQSVGVTAVRGPSYVGDGQVFLTALSTKGDRAEVVTLATGERRVVSVAGESAEAATLVGEEHQEVLTAIRALPDRQREALVLRYYLDLSEEETARAMGISRGTVKSTTSRAVAALARLLKEDA